MSSFGVHPHRGFRCSSCSLKYSIPDRSVCIYSLFAPMIIFPTPVNFSITKSQQMEMDPCSLNKNSIGMRKVV